MSVREVLEGPTGEVLASAGRIALVVTLAVVVRAVAHRAIDRLVQEATGEGPPLVLRPLRERVPPGLLDATTLGERRRQRAETVGSALRSVTSVVVLAVTVTTVLAELGVQLGPVLASAGIVGVAVGFGAQNVIKDWLNGMFMLLEDQYGVGDVVDVGPAVGTVESVSLRVTRLRSSDGTVWHVRNGEVLRVGNLSQGWSRSTVDVPVAWGADLAAVEASAQDVIAGLAADPEWQPRLLDAPEIQGVEPAVAAPGQPSGLLLRVSVRTGPADHAAVERELRRRLAVALGQRA